MTTQQLQQNFAFSYAPHPVGQGFMGLFTLPGERTPRCVQAAKTSEEAKWFETREEALINAARVLLAFINNSVAPVAFVEQGNNSRKGRAVPERLGRTDTVKDSARQAAEALFRK